jgi:hypothetical protein
MDGGIVADVRHRLDTAYAHHHVTRLAADPAGRRGRAGGVPDWRAAGAITFLEPTFIVVSWMAPGWLVLMLFFHLLMGRQNESFVLLLWLTTMSPLAQAADWLAWRKVGTPRSPGDRSPSIPPSCTPDGRYGREIRIRR